MVLRAVFDGWVVVCEAYRLFIGCCRKLEFCGICGEVSDNLLTYLFCDLSSPFANVHEKNSNIPSELQEYLVELIIRLERMTC